MPTFSEGQTLRGPWVQRLAMLKVAGKSLQVSDVATHTA